MQGGVQEVGYGLAGNEGQRGACKFHHFIPLCAIRTFQPLFLSFFGVFGGQLPWLHAFTCCTDQSFNSRCQGPRREGLGTSFSRMLSNERNKMTAGGCLGWPVGIIDSRLRGRFLLSCPGKEAKTVPCLTRW